MNQPQNTWQAHRRKIEDLTCTLYVPQSNRQPNQLVVLCHGYGAPGDDLVDLANPIIQRIAGSESVPVFVFPEAPIDLATFGIPGGRAWWPLNMARLMELNEKNDFSEMRDEVPPGMEEARSSLCRMIERTLSEFSLSMDSLSLGGFSQGAMLAVDTVLRGFPAPPSELIVMSGALVCESLWKANASKLVGLSVTQSHGTRDAILPIQTGRWLNRLFADAGAQVAYLEFDGPHTIPFDMIVKIASNLKSSHASRFD